MDVLATLGEISMIVSTSKNPIPVMIARILIIFITLPSANSLIMYKTMITPFRLQVVFVISSVSLC